MTSTPRGSNATGPMQQRAFEKASMLIFTVNRLGLPAALRTCLTTTNIIDSTHSGIRQRTRRVTNWKNGEMALRWSAVAFVETEKNYRRITGYEHLWMLKAHLDRDDDNVAEMQKVG